MVGWLNRHPILGGALLGLTWGLAIRIWMRFISTDPEFTWSGTGYIIGSATVVGSLLGVAALRRRHLGRGWWRLNGLAVLALGMGAGMVMIPSVLIGALALGRIHWRGWLRGLLLVAAAGIQVPIIAGTTMPAGRLLPAAAWYAVLIGSEALATSIVFRPHRATGTPAEVRLGPSRRTASPSAGTP
jgi:hypothetical protein